MNNKEFVVELSRSLGYTNKDATQLVASLVDIMTQEGDHCVKNLNLA